MDRERLIAMLAEFSYKRRAAISEEGDFAARGGIVDIFPYTYELPLRVEFEEETISSIRTFDPVKGEALWEHTCAIILPFRKAVFSKAQPFTEQYPMENFVDISVGDYVVHTDYGIGKFRGIQKIRVHDRQEDNLVIEYDRQEKLYVPVKKMHLVQKYIAFQARRPKLFRLGSKEWQRVKERARKGIQKMAWDLLSLQAMRMSIPGHRYPPEDEWQRKFEETFPFTVTPDQGRAMQEVSQDMESGKLVDRLLVGDVGYGKTEVAMRAAFKAVMDGRQVAYLVPTTILAEQHMQNFSARMKDFPVVVEMLSRFRTPAQQKDIVRRAGRGEVDILIGTHRLLSEDVHFKNLGLVIIDEEQRFGVKAKEKLKGFRLSTDVLTLTATPIPRTLYMSLMGAKDFSAINTPPENRLPIKTIVVEYDEDLIREAVKRELGRKGQVFFLHNRIEDIEKLKERIARLLPAGTRMAVGHGQMKAPELERIMRSFLKGETDILLSTMIIESGIDIPNANTIIVNNAHTFGLADLHQLRGRVGRYNRPAYSYFLVPRSGVISSQAQKRLKAIQDYAHLGAGFRIAMEDLEIRGAGNLLGIEQHGFVNAVGFDLYCRLLREAIETLKQAQVVPERMNG